IPVADFSHEVDEKAQIYLGIKTLGGNWSSYEDYFDNLPWLDRFRFQVSKTETYGNGSGPKAPNADTKDLHFVATMEFGSDSVRASEVTVTAAAATPGS